MRRLVIILVTAVMVCALGIGPALAEGGKFFQEWGVAGFYNQASDIDDGDLYGAGAMLHVAAPLFQEDSLQLDFRLEGQVGSFWDYGSGIEVAVLPGLRIYLGSASFKAYLEGGIGPSYNGMDIHELGTGFNFLSFGGVGVRFALSETMSLDIGYRLRHISNAGLDDRNSGVTSNQVQAGVALAF